MNQPQTPIFTHDAFAEERRAFRQLADTFARKTLSTSGVDFEYPAKATLEKMIVALTEAGFFSINLPVAFGGMGMSACLLAEVSGPLSKVDAGIAAILFAHTAALEILRLATPENPQGCNAAYHQITADTKCLVAFPAYTSPQENIMLQLSGDTSNTLTGRVPFVVLGGIARHVVVPARTTGSGWNYFLVDLMQPGVTRSAPILTLGLQAAQAVDIDFLSVSAIQIGAADNGTTLYQHLCESLAIIQMAMATGLMESVFKTAGDYAQQRIQGGRTIAHWPAIRMKLADMGIALCVAQHCLQNSVNTMLCTNGEAPANALATATHVTDLACRVASDGMQVLGGNGYMKDYHQEKRLRDARQIRTLLGLDGLKKLDFITTILEE